LYLILSPLSDLYIVAHTPIKHTTKETNSLVISPSDDTNHAEVTETVQKLTLLVEVVISAWTRSVAWGTKGTTV